MVKYFAESKDYYDSLSLYPFHLSGPSITQSLYEGVIAINERRSVSTSEWNNFSGVMKSYPIYKNINYTYPSVKVSTCKCIVYFCKYGKISKLIS